MAASTELSPRDVVKALQTLSDEKTKQLVFHLGVDTHELDDIETSYRAGDRSIHYIQAWLDRDTGASWEKIVSGLNDLGMNVLSRKLAVQHCPQSPYVATPSSDPSQPASVLATQPVTTPAPVTPAIPSSVATTSSNPAASDPIQRALVGRGRMAKFRSSIKKTFSRVISRVQARAASTSPPLTHHTPTSPAATTAVQQSPLPSPVPSNVDNTQLSTTAAEPSTIAGHTQSPTTVDHTQSPTVADHTQSPTVANDAQSPTVAGHAHPATVDTEPSTVAFLSLKEVKATILELEESFADITAEVGREISQKEEEDKQFLDKFRQRLLLLTVAKRASHVKFFRESEDDIVAAKSTKKIVAILCRYMDYRNYELLPQIVTRFCEGALQQKMQEYCWSLERFEKATAVDVYLTAVPDETSEEVKNTYSRVVVEVNKPTSRCTLYELRTLTRAIIRKSSLCSHSVYIGGVADKCVEMVVRFPSRGLGWVLSAFTPAFMQEYLITKVVVNGRQLTVLKAEGRELNDELIDASRKGDVIKVVSLLNSGAYINTTDRGLLATALYSASMNGYLQVVRLLLGRGSEVDYRTMTGRTPLINAAACGKCGVVRDLLDSGADVNAQDIDGESALIKAAYWGKTEVVVELVKAGALLNLQNTRGDSAVITATVRHMVDVLRVLVDAGSDLNVQNEEGLTALMISATSETNKITDILLEGEHIDLDIQENTTGWTALFFAAEKGNAATTQSLLKAGANTFLEDWNGLTVLEVAGSYLEEQIQYSTDRDYEGVCALLSSVSLFEVSTTTPSHQITSRPEQACSIADPDSSINDPDIPSTAQQDISQVHQDSPNDQYLTGTQQNSPTAAQDTPSTDQDTPSTDRDTPSANRDTPSPDQDSTSDQAMQVQTSSHTRSRAPRNVRSLVKSFGLRIQQLFNRLERRFKSADHKNPTRDIGSPDRTTSTAITK